jgi:hypothetical protein
VPWEIVVIPVKLPAEPSVSVPGPSFWTLPVPPSEPVKVPETA